jgi:hypothetical protein
MLPFYPLRPSILLATEATIALPVPVDRGRALVQLRQALLVGLNRGHALCAVGENVACVDCKPLMSSR